MIISCTTDIKYLNLLKILLRSLRVNSPSISTHIRCVNVPTEDRESLYKVNSNIIVDDDTQETISTKRNNLGRRNRLIYGSLFDNDQHQWTGPKEYNKTNRKYYNGARWLVSDMQCYCSNIRFDNILSCMNRFDDSVLYMDVDAIVRGDLGSLSDIVNDNDVTIKHNIYGKDLNRPIDHPGGIEWHCGIIGVNNNILSTQFINRVKSHVDNDMYSWDADQDAFNQVYNEMKTDVKIHNLPITYKDQGSDDRFLHGDRVFDNSSYIWSGAGCIKQNNNQYIDEMGRYNED